MRTSLQNRNEQVVAPSPLCISISSKRHNRRIADTHSGKLRLPIPLAIPETLVTGAGYQSILFDGINTYYLAEEHLALKPAFDIPPCNLDDFQFCRGHNFSHPITDAENHLAAALQRAEHAEAQLRAMQNSRAWRTLQKPKKVLVRA